MTTSSNVPYEWLKSLNPELAKLDTIPLLGLAPEFPWEQFSQSISKTFDIESLTVKPGELRWREQDELHSDLGDQLHIQKVTLSSLKGEICFLFDKEDLRFIIYALLNKSKPNELQIYDDDIEAGLYRFLALEAVQAFTESDFDKTLSPHLLENQTLNDDSALGLDLQITLLDRTLGARLLISKEFQQSWNERYAERTMETPVSSDLLQKLETTLHLKVGEIALSQEELKSLKEGDLVLLDQCTYDPVAEKGEVVLTLNGSPKVRGSLENNKLTILQAPLFHEEITFKGE